ncbi:multidrug efflux SMR transporter [Paenibacillus sp. CF384]|uniref:DMT family transporter n=1 Tax=Paenibacillus sp. CF384 TaxID=1884382 RepID=UPI000897AAF6|nr:multidrug efflux SMR transporter [Paenibacillus sp. CF384]SDX25848.1 quaternary ammonium compound-resistance protein SugE [Paenibacillus sp. CF384]
MAWLYLLLAGLLEVGWAYGMQASDGFTEWLPSVITIVLLIISFMLFARAMRTIEIGTAYAIFTGIGTVGTVIVGIVRGEPADLLKLLFIAMLIGGIVGLKVISSKEETPKKPQAEHAVPEATE